MKSFNCSLFTAVFILLYSFLLHASLSSAQAVEPYFAPHEKRVFDAFNNLDKDFNALRSVFDENAVVHVTLNDDEGNPIVKSGTFDEIFGGHQSMKRYRVKWEPITNTHPNHPNRGVFANKYWDYGLYECGCEALFSGIGTIQVSTCKVFTPRKHSLHQNYKLMASSPFLHCLKLLVQ